MKNLLLRVCHGIWYHGSTPENNPFFRIIFQRWSLNRESAALWGSDNLIHGSRNGPQFLFSDHFHFFLIPVYSSKWRSNQKIMERNDYCFWRKVTYEGTEKGTSWHYWRRFGGNAENLKARGTDSDINPITRRTGTLLSDWSQDGKKLHVSFSCQYREIPALMMWNR